MIVEQSLHIQYRSTPGGAWYDDPAFHVEGSDPELVGMLVRTLQEWSRDVVGSFGALEYRVVERTVREEEVAV
jgi:hypothetical protein